MSGLGLTLSEVTVRSLAAFLHGLTGSDQFERQLRQLVADARAELLAELRAEVEEMPAVGWGEARTTDLRVDDVLDLLARKGRDA